MTHSKLVLVSNSEAATKLAHGEDYCILVRQNGKKLTAADNTCDLPAEHFLTRQNIATSCDNWISVIEWLKKLSGSAPFLIIDYDHPLRELMLLAKKVFGYDYGLFIANYLERISVPEYALLGTANGIVFEQASHEDAFKSVYVGPFSSTDLATYIGKKPSDVTSNPTPIVSQNDAKRILIISYFSGPCRTVGVQRVNYWAEEMARLSGDAFDVHLATAINWQSPDVNVHYVPDLYIASLFESEDGFPKWAPAFFDLESSDAKSFNTLSYYWRYALEKYFDEFSASFDVVIISGNPFSVFDFAAYAKRRWYSKVLLDYRDPFANNPRVKFPDEARDYAKFVERGYNFQADICVSVNDSCLKYIENKEDVGVLTIPNGYDERAFAPVTRTPPKGDKIKFAHAGSFYHDRSPQALIENMNLEQHQFLHVGKIGGIDIDILDGAGVTCYGPQSYDGTLKILSGADCGIVFVTSSGFETPTKLYDYLALGLDILLCTHGPIKAGALAAVLKDYPNVFWCKNTDQGIKSFLDTYVPTRENQVATERFTRQYGTEILIEAIQKLIEN